MILRRVIAHFRKQEWTAIFLDFVIVVLGVFVGFQVNNWNEVRKERADESAALSQMHEEVVAVEDLSSRILSDRLATLHFLSEIVDRLYAGTDGAPTDDHCLAIASSHDLYVGLADLPSYMQLQSSGRVGIIRDRPLLQALGGLAQARQALEFALANFGPRLINLAEDHAGVVLLAPRTISVANAPALTERDYAAVCDFVAFRKSPALRNALVSNLEYFDAFARDGLRPWVRELGNVHDRLDAALSIIHDERP
jgi:hypothetical protein